MIGLTALVFLFPSFNPAQDKTASSRLSEPRESRANEIPPPEKVMDLIGIRPACGHVRVGALKRNGEPSIITYRITPGGDGIHGLLLHNSQV